MKNFVFNIFFLAFAGVSAQNTITIGSTVVKADTIQGGLDIPWEIIYGPDDHLWITERKGVVSRINPLTKTKAVILDIQSSVYVIAEAGLLGMALHPDFDVNKEVFLVYTYGSSGNVKERLVKYIYNGSVLINPQIILDNIGAANAHDGSRLMFMPDKTLLMTTGDAHIALAPQSINALNGKVLRLNTDGTVPGDNPFPGSMTYSFGHRNTQGLCVTPGGRYFISEHGTANDDEFQELEKGRNYGWPDVQGYCDQPSELTFCAANNVKEPLVDWTPSIAPSDVVYYSNNSFPEFHESFLMTTLKNKQLISIRLNSAGTASVSHSAYLTNMFGRLRDICTGPSQEIYIATNGQYSSNLNPNTHNIIMLSPPSPTVSTAELSEAECVIFPTVTEDLINIELKSRGNHELKIYDITGRIRIIREIHEKKQRVSVNTLPAGIYFAVLEKSGKRIYQCKIIRKD
jgi:aldose sugar dehydrogenase